MSSVALPRDSIVQIALHLGCCVGDVLSWASVDRRHRRTICGETSDVDSAALWRSVLESAFGSDASRGVEAERFKQRALFLTKKTFSIRNERCTLDAHCRAVVSAAEWPLAASMYLTGLLAFHGCDRLLSTLLDAAAAAGEHTLEQVIAKSSDPRDAAPSMTRFSLVRAAALFNKPACLAKVLSFDEVAQPFLRQKSGWCRVPLQEAVVYVGNGDLSCVKLLLAQLDVPGFWAFDSDSSWDEDGSNLMHLAVRTGRADVVALLCQPVPPLDVPDVERDELDEYNAQYKAAVVTSVVHGVEHGRTPLAAACNGGHVDVVRELLSWFRVWEQEGRVTVKEAVNVEMREYYGGDKTPFRAIDDARKKQNTPQAAEIVRLLEEASQ